MADLWQFAQEEAQRQGVDPRLVAAVMRTESGGRANAQSSAGARGPMQLMPGTARDLGVNIDDPQDNIRGGVRYLSQMLQQFGGDQRLATAAYNAGPGAVQRSLSRTGDIPAYAETQNYVRRIAGLTGDTQEPKVKHGLDIDPSWLEEGGPPAAKAPAAAAASAPRGPQPAAISADWLEPADAPTAAPAARVAPAAQAQPVDSGPGLPSSMDELGRRLSTVLPIQKDPTDGKYKMIPGVGGVVRGLAAIPMLADRLGTKLSRAMPAALGGNPNDKEAFATDLDQAITDRTLKPNNIVEAGISKAGEYIGSGLGGGAVVGGLGRVAKAAGLARTGNVLATAGAATPGSIAGSVTGGAAADATDALVGQHIESPTIRTGVNMLAGLLGGAPGAALGNRLGGVAASAETAATLAAAKQAGIPVQASDISPTMAKLKQAVADKIPLGNLTASGVPAKQVAGVQRELRTVAERYRPQDLNPGAGTTGTDRYLAQDLRARYAQAKAATNAAYAQVDDALKANPDLPPIQLDASKAAAKELLEQYPATFRDITLSKDAKEALGLIKAATTPKQLDKVKVGGVGIDLSQTPGLRAALEAQGVKTTTQPKVGLQEARDLASELWDAANRAGKGAFAGGGSQKQAGALKKLAQAVGADVDGYMANAPDSVRGAYANADKVFREQVLPFRADPKVYRLVSSRTPKADFDTEAQGLYSNLFNTSQGERSAMALSLMSDKGKQAAAYQALKEAGEKGLSNTGPEGLKAVQAMRSLDVEGNPALANIAQHYPDLAKEADRLRGLLQIGRSASAALGRRQAATGIQNMPMVTGGAMLGGASAMGNMLGNQGLGYATMIGAPIAGANAFNLVNRLGARAAAAGPGPASQRIAPGMLQGLLAGEEPVPEPDKQKKRKGK